jgi:hypothetical protein
MQDRSHFARRWIARHFARVGIALVEIPGRPLTEPVEPRLSVPAAASALHADANYRRPAANPGGVAPAITC